MLKLPVKLALIGASIFTVILGTHGLYVYFSYLETIFDAPSWGKLFLALEVPSRLASVVTWMTVKGLQSWFIPASFIVGGLVLWGFQQAIRVRRARLPRWLRWLW